jgi:hypothetical protein
VAVAPASWASCTAACAVRPAACAACGVRGVRRVRIRLADAAAAGDMTGTVWRRISDSVWTGLVGV